MKRDGHTNVAFFVGPEVEHTPAFSKKTLFVVGKQDVETIERIAREQKTPHIFMGANHSFDVDSTDGTMYWDQTITALLDKGFWVSLDYPAHQHDKVLLILNKGIWQSRIFVPVLSVRIANLQTSSPNLTIKIDDIDFKATNDGVWCWNHQAITDANRFTDWQDYGTDLVIEVEDDKPTPMPPYIPAPVVPAARIDITKLHPIEQTALKDPDVMAGFVETSPVKNDELLGLDPDAKSLLKPDPDAVATAKALDIVDAASAADAYAEGAKEDPLSKEASKKPVKAKK